MAQDEKIKQLQPMRGLVPVQIFGEKNQITATKSDNPDLGYTLVQNEEKVFVQFAGLKFIPENGTDYSGRVSALLNTVKGKRNFGENTEFGSAEEAENILLADQIANINIPLNYPNGELWEENIHPYSVCSGIVLLTRKDGKDIYLAKPNTPQYSILGGRYAARVETADEETILIKIPSCTGWRTGAKDVEGFEVKFKIERPIDGKPTATAILYINGEKLVSKFDDVLTGLDWLRLNTPKY